MAQHYEQSHGGAGVMSEALCAVVALKAREREHVSSFLTSLKQAKNACADRECECNGGGKRKK